VDGVTSLALLARVLKTPIKRPLSIAPAI
jgi:hypothetical protein